VRLEYSFLNSLLRPLLPAQCSSSPHASEAKTWSLTLELRGHAVGPAASRTPGPGSLVELGQEAVNLHFSAHYGQFCERHGPAQKQSGVLVTPQRLHDSVFCTDKSNMHQKSNSGTDGGHLDIEQRVSSGVTCTPAIAGEMPAHNFGLRCCPGS